MTLVISSTAQLLPNGCPTVTVSSVIAPIPVCNTNAYVLMFDDNFNENSLNLHRWNPQNGVTSDSSFSQKKEWFKQSNIVVSNGTLKLVAKSEVTTGTYVIDYSTNPFTMATSTFNR